jgi:hypothetical protein
VFVCDNERGGYFYHDITSKLTLRKKRAKVSQSISFCSGWSFIICLSGSLSLITDRSKETRLAKIVFLMSKSTARGVTIKSLFPGIYKNTSVRFPSSHLFL